MKDWCKFVCECVVFYNDLLEMMEVMFSINIFVYIECIVECYLGELKG